MDRADHLGQPVSAIGEATEFDAADWAAMRHALWPHNSLQEHAADIAGMLSRSDGKANFIARLPDGTAAGFAEASIRHDYVNGCKTSPVAFLEGIYVVPAYRRTGMAGRLVAVVEAWAMAQHCTEMASDTSPDNVASQQLHVALGFTETQRVIFFRKLLDRP